uniref:Bulb-type lectin domain-containing protein n=1 Tax=Trieres chinensis TaxID=1514140 RepID=A0A7S2A580_TRICV|mmetsp:Transcript_414/g.912  ORF Transcript_414/g.912 Transcript_414/m.912 type:complete len:412 (+) Transcript_414:88-1323(+)
MRVPLSALACFHVFVPVYGTNWKCVGDKLGPGERLRRNEFVCAGGSDAAHRIGLNSEGTLVQYDGDEVDWTPGASGKYLIMQRTGQLVLRDDKDDPTWASGCYAEGAFLGFLDTYPGLGARTFVETPEYVKDEDYWTVWSTDPHPRREVMDRTRCTPPFICKGRGTLRPKESLRRNEYLCAVNKDDRYYRNANSYMFGVDNKGEVVLRKGRYDPNIWSSGKDTRGGTELKLQRKGNLVLRDKDGNALWASGCKSAGNTLKLTGPALTMMDKHDKISWFIDYRGKHSKCFPDKVPSDKCAKVSAKGKVCKMKMIDSLNKINTVLEVKDLGNNRYRVTDDIEGKKPWKEIVEILDTGAILTDAGVPEVTCHDLLEDYEMEDDSQLTFKKQGKQCTEFSENLIYFMIMEWFYFG